MSIDRVATETEDGRSSVWACAAVVKRSETTMHVSLRRPRARGMSAGARVRGNMGWEPGRWPAVADHGPSSGWDGEDGGNLAFADGASQCRLFAQFLARLSNVDRASGLDVTNRQVDR